MIIVNSRLVNLNSLDRNARYDIESLIILGIADYVFVLEEFY